MFCGITLVLAAAPAFAALEVTGLIQPAWEATLAATVLGRVDKLRVKEGDRVAAGTVLLELERRSEEIDAARRKVVLDSKVELELARAKLAVLREDLAGTQKLFDSTKSVSKDDLAKKTLEFKLAESELAQFAQREDIEALEYEFAAEQVRRREIAAPQAGTVVEILPKVGEVCEPRQPLLRLVDATTVRIALDVEPLRTTGIAVGQPAAVVVTQPGGEITATGTVDYVAPIVDAASGLRRIRVTIANADGRLLPGLTAMVKISGGR